MNRNRGRSNSNERGNTKTRRARKQRLLDRDGDGTTATCSEPGCDTTVSIDTMFVDRKIPGENGGTYADDNCKIHCCTCSGRQGARRTHEIRKAKKIA